MKSLSSRDRVVLIIGAVVLVLFVLVQFFVLPLLDKRKRLNRLLVSHSAAISSMKEMQAQYGQLHQQSNTITRQLGQRASGFSLFTFLESIAAENAVKEHIAYMKPSAVTGAGPFKQVLVEMKLQAIGLQQMVSFLQGVESPEKVVAIKRLSVQENKKEAGTLDVIVQVISIDDGQGE